VRWEPVTDDPPAAISGPFWPGWSPSRSWAWLFRWSCARLRWATVLSCFSPPVTLPFSLYTAISSTVARSLKFSRALLFYPSVTWIDAVLARFILNSLTGLMVTYILLAGILLLNDTRVVLDLVSIFQALSLAILLGFGVGVLNCLLTGLFPIWERLWSIVTRPLFLASGVFFVMEDLPAVAQDILWYHPLIHITGLMRVGFYPMYSPGYLSAVYVITCTLVTLAMGLLLLQRHHKKILND